MRSLINLEHVNIQVSNVVRHSAQKSYMSKNSWTMASKISDIFIQFNLIVLLQFSSKSVLFYLENAYLFILSETKRKCLFHNFNC